MDRSSQQRAKPFRVAAHQGLTPPASAAARRKALRRIGPLASSTLLHFVLLLVLGLLTVPILERGSLLVTLLKQGEVIDLEESVHLVDDLPRISNEELQAAALDRNSLLAELPTLTPLPDPAKEDVEPVGSDETAVGAPMRIEASIGAGGPLNDVSTVEEAVDRVTAGIRGRLEKGDLLVIWLLDASNSLVDDRQRVAERLKSFFLEIQSSG